MGSSASKRPVVLIVEDDVLLHSDIQRPGSMDGLKLPGAVRRRWPHRDRDAAAAAGRARLRVRAHLRWSWYRLTEKHDEVVNRLRESARRISSLRACFASWRSSILTIGYR